METVYESEFLEICRDTLIRLDRRDCLQELHQMAKVWKHWAIAMQAGYKMKPTREDRVLTCTVR